MENHIDQIEKFLRGQMNQEEEGTFKESLAKDANLRLSALILTYVLMDKKSW